MFYIVALHVCERGRRVRRLVGGSACHQSPQFAEGWQLIADRFLNTRASTVHRELSISATAITITPACTGSVTTRSAASEHCRHIQLITSSPAGYLAHGRLDIAPSASGSTSAFAAKARHRPHASASGAPHNGIVSTNVFAPNVVASARRSPHRHCPTARAPR